MARARATSEQPVVRRRLDPGRLRDPRRRGHQGAQNRPAVQPPRRDQGQLLLAFHRHRRVSRRARRRMGRTARRRSPPFRRAGRRSTARTPVANDDLAGQPPALDAGTRDAGVGPHRRRRRGQRARRRPACAGRRAPGVPGLRVRRRRRRPARQRHLRGRHRLPAPVGPPHPRQRASGCSANGFLDIMLKP